MDFIIIVYSMVENWKMSCRQVESCLLCMHLAEKVVCLGLRGQPDQLGAGAARGSLLISCSSSCYLEQSTSLWGLMASVGHGICMEFRLRD